MAAPGEPRASRGTVDGVLATHVHRTYLSPQLGGVDDPVCPSHPLAAAAVRPGHAPSRADRVSRQPWRCPIFAVSLAGVLFSVACSPPPEPSTGHDLHSPRGAPSREGRGTAASGAGLAGRFDRDGAHLSSFGASIGVRTVGWEDTDGAAPISVEPALGACPSDPSGSVGECRRRVQYARGGLTEWWVRRGAGYEQGWTVANRRGDGRGLSIEVVVDNATSTVHDGAVRLRRSDGGVIKVSKLHAWDAYGVVLEARFDWAPDGFVVRVEDSQATYPITVDPVYEAEAILLSSPSGTDDFGEIVASAGDVNGDGYGDVLVADPGFESGVAEVSIFQGAASGLSSAPTTILHPLAGNGSYLAKAAPAGDVDGDGFDDVIVSDDGVPLVYPGSSAGLSTEPSATLVIDGEAAPTSVVAVSGAGDVNGDGYDDVLVGRTACDTGPGQVFVYEGSPGGLATTAAATITGVWEYDCFGVSLASAGDVNGDGYDDVVVGASYPRAYFPGRAYVYHGSAAGLATTATTTLTGDAAYQLFGIRVSTAGDVDGDGYDDVLVAAPNYLEDGQQKGRVHVYPGSATGLSDVAARVLTGPASDYGANLGYSVAAAGDVNRDGFHDIVVGSWGHAYVYQGSADGIPDEATTVLSNPRPEIEFYGYPTSGAGDVAGDGYNDVIVGAFSLVGGIDGFAAVYYGYGDETDTGTGTNQDTGGETETGGTEGSDTGSQRDTAHDGATDGGKQPSPGCGCGTGGGGGPGAWAGFLALLLVRRRRVAPAERGRLPDTEPP